MQTLTWYFRRLKSMSPEEMGWRALSGLRDVLDRIRIPLGMLPVSAAAGQEKNTSPGFRVSDVELGEWISTPRGSTENLWRDRLMSRADSILQGQLSFFGLVDRNLGDPIDWNRDHEFGKSAPMRVASALDYRDFRVTGDAKVVWEPNRHHQLVLLGRAWRATGDRRYAEGLAKQLDSWLRQCPFGMGMNWRSPLELGIRLINWVWAVDMIRDSGELSDELMARIRYSAFLHMWDIARKYSRGSSSNNHLIGEAAGVFIGSSYFRDFPEAARWSAESGEILSREILAQTYPDGCSREHAFGYHMFVLQFFLAVAVTSRKCGQELPESYLSRLEKMLEFAAAMAEGGGTPSMNGDSDDGYVLDLGAGPADIPALMSTAAVMFGRSDFKSLSNGYAEPTRWLLGRDSRSAYDSLETRKPDYELESRAFPESGYYLLQSGRRNSGDAVSVFFDCAELGFQTIAAHGHADALSFTLRAFGADVFVDPGTYDYFSFPKWRHYFRSTRAHNTVMIDRTDQSEMLGSFLWGARAKCLCTGWKPDGNCVSVAGTHDGYRMLEDPVTHQRSLELDSLGKILTIRDEILGKASHDVELWFHLSEECHISQVNPNCYDIAVGDKKISFHLDPKLRVVIFRGSENPIGGWVSRGYHRKKVSIAIVGSGRCVGNEVFFCRLYFGNGKPIDN